MSDPEVQTVCPTCGARTSPGSATCDLCGSPLDQVETDSGAEITAAAPADRDPEPQVPETGPPPFGGVFCNQCGWKNPVEARFCSRCGSALQEVSGSVNPGERAVLSSDIPEPLPSSRGGITSSTTGSSTTASRAAARRLPADARRMSVVLVAGSFLLVLVLYAVTVFSKNAFVPDPDDVLQTQATENVAVTDAIPEDVQATADRIRASADSLTGAARAARLAEVVNVYLARGLFEPAGDAQEDVARALESAAAWADAGNLHYRAMQNAEGPSKIGLATRAIDAYTRSLELDPDNLDVRTDMATSYLATNNPMEGVRQIRQVLSQDADHVQANFNYGVMLSMIGRTDQSIKQFERVRELVPAGSETYVQATAALEELRGP